MLMPGQSTRTASRSRVSDPGPQDNSPLTTAAFAQVMNDLIDGELKLEKYHVQQNIKAKKPATGL